MYRRIISLLTLGAFAVYSMGFTGCAKFTRLSPKETIISESGEIQNAQKLIEGKTVIVHTRDRVYRFERNFAYVNTKNQTIEGYSADNQRVTIPFTDVTRIETKSSIPTGTVLLGVGVLVFAVLPMLLWDGLRK